MSGKKYNIGCTVETLEPSKEPGIFRIKLTAEVLSDGLRISQRDSGGNQKDMFGRSVHVGVFHRLSSENSSQPFIMSYKSMESVSGIILAQDNSNTWMFEKRIDQPFIENISDNKEFKIEIVYKNEKKGLKLLVDINSDNNPAIIDLYNQTLGHKTASLGLIQSLQSRLKNILKK